MDELLGKAVAVILLVIGVYLCHFGTKLLRDIIITRKNTGPPFYELVTVHCRNMLRKDYELLTYMTKMIEEFKFNPGGFWFGLDYVAFVSDPISAKEVYRSKHMCDKSDVFFGDLRMYVGEGSIVINGKEWKTHRNVINAAFQKEIRDPQMYVYYDEAMNMVRRLLKMGENQNISLSVIVKEQFLQVATGVLSSDQMLLPDKVEACQILSAALAASHRKVLNPFLRWATRKLPIYTKTDSIIHKAVSRYKKIFAAERKKAAARLEMRGNNKPLSMVEYMIQGNLKTGDFLNEQGFCDELLMLVVAIWETSSASVIFAILMLAVHQDIQQRAFEEVESILGLKNEPIPIDDLSKLEYLEMIIKETLRMFPPVPMLPRNVNEETQLNGLILPKDSTVVLHVFALHRNPNCFKEPLKFDPQRFSPERSADIPPFAYLPFSYGSRACAGKIQVIMGLKIVLSVLLRNFKILPGDEIKTIDDIKLEMNITAHVCNPFVRLIHRNTDS